MKFWMVWKAEGAAPAYKHHSEASARAEAERLARTLGGTFYVLEAIARCDAVDVVWSESEDLDDIPF